MLCALAVVFFALLGMAMIVIETWPSPRPAQESQDGVLRVQKDIHLYEQGFKALVQRVKAPNSSPKMSSIRMQVGVQSLSLAFPAPSTRVT